MMHRSLLMVIFKWMFSGFPLRSLRDRYGRSPVDGTHVRFASTERVVFTTRQATPTLQERAPTTQHAPKHSQFYYATLPLHLLIYL